MDYVIEPRAPCSQPEGVVAGYAQTAQRWPSQPPLRRRPGAAEVARLPDLTGRLPLSSADLAGRGEKRAIGQLIEIDARVVDEDGSPVSGAVVEIWHCNAAGKYIHPNDDNDAPADPNFYGAARLLTGEDGAIRLRTIKPAAYPVPDTGGWWRPPHVHFSVFGRVWLSRLVTQMFFPGEPLNEHDAILNAVPDAEARSRCVARLVPRENILVYEYQLVVRGRKASPRMP